MAILKVQFTHPGKQKPFSLKNGYRTVGDRFIRVWNDEEPDHFRKFLKNNGEYLNNLSDRNPTSEGLFFWGEWEGHSFFEVIKNPDERVLPNGIHEPFHSNKMWGNQNTDPYIFGEYFKYCICKQKGQMKKLDPNSIILFGSVYPSLNRFYIDTLFVVKDFETSINVQTTNGSNYSQTYKEETLEQLEEYLKMPKLVKDNKVYHSQTWWDNKEYFSFVPCKLNHTGNGFERLWISLDNPEFKLSSYPRGKSHLNECKFSSPEQLWRRITEIAFEQGFKLGIRFEEPPISNILDNL